MADPTDFSKMDPSAEMMREAKKNPNGWVYVIQGEFSETEAVPPEAIAGAWRVDASGDIVAGSYTPNPRFKGTQS